MPPEDESRGRSASNNVDRDVLGESQYSGAMAMRKQALITTSSWPLERTRRYVRADGGENACRHRIHPLCSFPVSYHQDMLNGGLGRCVVGSVAWSGMNPLRLNHHSRSDIPAYQSGVQEITLVLLDASIGGRDPAKAALDGESRSGQYRFQKGGKGLGCLACIRFEEACCCQDCCELTICRSRLQLTRNSAPSPCAG